MKEITTEEAKIVAKSLITLLRELVYELKDLSDELNGIRK